jgi:N-acetylglucosaminyl-diphospho-decaprenol L-rhamnosyltransferase
VDAIIVAYFGDPWLAECVKFIHVQPEDGVRLLLGDNFGNTAVDTYRGGGFIEVIKLSGPLGFAEANNRMLIQEGLGTDFYCFLNQDTRCPAGWLSRVSEFLAYHPRIGAVTPLISTYDGRGWDPNFVDCARMVGNDWERQIGFDTDADFHEVPVIPAPAMVVRAEVLRKVGGFDPIYGSYYEDYDLCHRIRAAGYKVGIWTGATVAHFSGSATRTPEAEARRQRQIVRNRIIYRVRTEPRGRLPQLARELFVELPRQFARRVLGRPASKPLGVLLGGYWDAAKVGHRLVSARVDEAAFRRYLKALGWPLSQD